MPGDLEELKSDLEGLENLKEQLLDQEDSAKAERRSVEHKIRKLQAQIAAKEDEIIEIQDIILVRGEDNFV